MTTFERRAILLTILMTIGGAGCGQRLGRVPSQFQNDHESGIAVIGNNYTFSASTTVHTDKPVLFTLKSNEPYTYNNRTVYPDFRAYVNPMKPPGAPGDVKVTFTDPIMSVSGGWTYFAGISPMGETTRVRGVGEGTRMIIEVDESVVPSIHRVYFVGDKGCQIKIYVPPPPPAANPVFTMTKIGTYIEVYDNLTWVDKGPYAADKTRAAFVAHVLSDTQYKGVN